MMNSILSNIATVSMLSWVVISQAAAPGQDERPDGEHSAMKLAQADTENAGDEIEADKESMQEATNGDFEIPDEPEHPDEANAISEKVISEKDTADKIAAEKRDCRRLNVAAQTLPEFRILVQDTAGQPVKKAKVTLEWENVTTAQKKTGRNGTTTFFNVPLSVPHLKVIASGYDTYTGCIDLANFEDLHTVTLERR